jgi:hypothetical protein
MKLTSRHFERANTRLSTNQSARTQEKKMSTVFLPFHSGSTDRLIEQSITCCCPLSRLISEYDPSIAEQARIWHETAVADKNALSTRPTQPPAVPGAP